MQLKLHNTLTREKQAFIPLNPEHVGMYVCGITPYDDAHIGNLRTMVVFDILFRVLRQVYGEDKVTYVRNYTDIDDKIVRRAAETGKQPFDVAAEYIDIFERDMAALNMLEPTEKPRVSQHLQGIVKMVDELLHKGFAYVTESGDVMFSVPKFEELPNPPHNPFGYIARRTFDKLHARVEEDAEKRDPRDFPVWKANAKSATKMEQAFNPAELGAVHPQFTALGRPGWHIECSVMSEAILGQHYKPGHAALFDIHGGGEDLTFPHHSCEIAQTEALHPTCTMSSVWMHAAFITVNGTKMSKSLGNFTTVKDALAKYSPEAIRLWLLQTHYRKPVDYSDEALQAAENAIKSLYGSLKIFGEIHRDQNDQMLSLHKVDYSIGSESGEYDPTILEEIRSHLVDDLDTSKSLASLFKLRQKLSSNDNEIEKKKLANTLVKSMGVLGLWMRTPSEYFKDTSRLGGVEDSMTDEGIEAVIRNRHEAKSNKKFEIADQIRDLLKEKGIILEDHKDGTTTWRRA